MNAYDLANELAFKTIEGDPSGALLGLVIDRLRIQADSIVGLKLSWQAVQDENEKLKAELTEAGGIIGVLREYISDLEKGLDSSIKLNKVQAERNQ